jgi:hypothetical protein
VFWLVRSRDLLLYICLCVELPLVHILAKLYP